MRVLVLGAAGIVGRATVAEAARRGWDVRGLSRAECDIGVEDAPARAATDFRPQLLVNCAAFTKVDACESDPTRALAINGEAVGRVAMAAASVGARLIHLSTDYVFDGTGNEPYAEVHPTAPRSVSRVTKTAPVARSISGGSSEAL